MTRNALVPAVTASDDSRAAVITKATVRAAKFLGLNNAALAIVIGLSEATVSRMASGSYLLDPRNKSYELSLLLLRLFRSLDAMVGGEEGPMQSWMKSNNLVLSGIPAEKIQTITGLVDAVNYVDASRARI